HAERRIGHAHQPQGYGAPALGRNGGLVPRVAAHGDSHRPEIADRYRASMTRMLAIASSIGNSCVKLLRNAAAARSHCSWYWSTGAKSSTTAALPSRLTPESITIRQACSFGGVNGTDISIRPSVPSTTTRW